jgi:hypothetical protein
MRYTRLHEVQESNSQLTDNAEIWCMRKSVEDSGIKLT